MIKSSYWAGVNYIDQMDPHEKCSTKRALKNGCVKMPVWKPKEFAWPSRKRCQRFGVMCLRRMKNPGCFEVLLKSQWRVLSISHLNAISDERK